MPGGPLMGALRGGGHSLFTISPDMTNWFFDRSVVADSMSRAKRKALSRAGMIIRASARKSIKSAEMPSKPGQPPRDVTGLLRDFIFYAWDPVTDSVVVGPELKQARRAAYGLPVPEVLEKGGLTRRKYSKSRPPRFGPWFRLAARPYMMPALERHISDLPEQFRHSVTTK